METKATILHADLDAFYASVEQLLDPSLRGKPIAVGGGVVLAASYEAKSFGISSGMSGWRARELCPQLIFVGGHFQDYQRLGEAAGMVARANSRSRSRREADGARMESRPTGDQDTASSPIGRSPISARQEARSRASFPTDAASSCRQGGHQTSGEIPARSDCDSARSLCRHALCHAVCNP